MTWRKESDVILSSYLSLCQSCPRQNLQRKYTDRKKKTANK